MNQLKLPKEPKEYRVEVLKGSLYKKKFKYRNKEQFLKYLRISVSNEHVIKLSEDQIEIPAESEHTVKFTIQTEDDIDVYMRFIRYDTDEEEEVLVFKITLR